MSITLDQAQTLIGGALAEARKLNLKPVSVIVLDIRGSIVAAASEDGVSAMRARIAHGKANAAIALGMGTRALMNRAEQQAYFCLLYTSPSPRDLSTSRMPSSA